MQDSAINLFLANALSSLADERTPEELWKLLDQVEELLPVRNTCPDFPFVLVPATIAPPDRWEQLLSSYRFPPGMQKRLQKRPASARLPHFRKILPLWQNGIY